MYGDILVAARAVFTKQGEIADFGVHWDGDTCGIGGNTWSVWPLHESPDYQPTGFLYDSGIAWLIGGGTGHISVNVLAQAGTWALFRLGKRRGPAPECNLAHRRVADSVTGKVVNLPRDEKLLRAVSRMASIRAVEHNLPTSQLAGAIAVGYVGTLPSEAEAAAVIQRATSRLGSLRDTLLGAATATAAIALASSSPKAAGPGLLALAAAGVARAIAEIMLPQAKQAVRRRHINAITAVAGLTAGALVYLSGARINISAGRMYASVIRWTINKCMSLRSLAEVATVAALPVAPLATLGSVAHRSMMFDVLVSPVIEETIKSNVPFATALIAGFEYIRSGMAATYVPTGIMHFVWAATGPRWGTIAHALWNLSVHMASPAAAVMDWRVECDTCVSDFVPASTQALRAGSTIRPIVDTCEPRPCVYAVGPHLDTPTPVMYRQCHHNAELGLRERVLGPTPTCATGEGVVNGNYLTARTRYLTTHWARRLKRPVTATEYDAWRIRFPAPTAAALAEYELIADVVPDKLDSRYKAFVKREMQIVNKDELDAKVGAPRIIQGREMHAKAFTGPWLHAYSKRVGVVLKDDAFYASSTTSEELGSWFGESIEICGGLGRATMYSIDVNRFDKCVPAAGMRELAYHYRRASCPETLASYLQARSRTKRGITSTGTRYTVVASVASGDGDTSCGDTLITLYAVMYLFRDIPQRRGLFRVAICGDDAVLIVHPDVDRLIGGLPAVQAAWAALGLDIEARRTVDPWEVDFCSGLFWPAVVEGTPGYVHGPKIGRQLAKLFYADKLMSEPDRLSHIRGIALGLRHSTHHVPILRAVMAGVLRDTDGYIATESTGWVDKVRAAASNDADEANTDCYMLCHYNMSPADTAEVEEWILQQDLSGPTLLSDPRLRAIFDVDVT